MLLKKLIKSCENCRFNFCNARGRGGKGLNKSILRDNMLGYLSANIISSESRTGAEPPWAGSSEGKHQLP